MDTKEYRQVVSDKSITSSKSFNDYLYGWLVLKAQEENGERFVMKRSFVFSKMEKELGMTRKTLAKYFDYLLEVGLVVDSKDKWTITDLGEDGFWLETNILQKLVEMKQRYAITIYVYLVKGYWMVGQHKKKNLPIILDNVKDQIGISKQSRSNNNTITDVLENLREMGLLNYWLWLNPQTGKRFYLLSGIGKTNYF